MIHRYAWIMLALTQQKLKESSVPPKCSERCSGATRRQAIIVRFPLTAQNQHIHNFLNVRFIDPTCELSNFVRLRLGVLLSYWVLDQDLNLEI